MTWPSENTEGPLSLGKRIWLAVWQLTIPKLVLADYIVAIVAGSVLLVAFAGNASLFLLPTFFVFALAYFWLMPKRRVLWSLVFLAVFPTAAVPFYAWIAAGTSLTLIDGNLRYLANDGWLTYEGGQYIYSTYLLVAVASITILILARWFRSVVRSPGKTRP